MQIIFNNNYRSHYYNNMGSSFCQPLVFIFLRKKADCAQRSRRRLSKKSKTPGGAGQNPAPKGVVMFVKSGISTALFFYGWPSRFHFAISSDAS